MRIDELIEHGDKRRIRAEIIRLLKKSDPRTIGDFNKLVGHALDNFKRAHGPFDNMTEDDQIAREMIAYAQQASRQIPRNTNQVLAKQKIINNILKVADLPREDLEMLSISELVALKKEYSQ